MTSAFHFTPESELIKLLGIQVYEGIEFTSPTLILTSSAPNHRKIIELDCSEDRHNMISSTSSQKFTPSDFIFEGGDVEITLQDGGTQFKGRVCSQPMVLASPVFKRFIYPPWQVAQPSAKFSFFTPQSDSNPHPALLPFQPPIGSIDFTEDSPSALLLILNIIHLKLDTTPSDVSSAELLQLALLCEQYQCARLIRTFAQDWVEKEAEFDYSREVGKDSWLFICWTFGIPDMFSQLAKELVLEVTLDGEGNVRFPNEGYYGEMQMVREVMPDKAIGISLLPFLNLIRTLKAMLTLGKYVEGILAARERMLERLLALPYAWIDDFETINDDHHQNWPLCGLPACSAMVYGSLLLRLQVAQLWPRRKASEIYWSVATVAADIKGLALSVHIDMNEMKHDTCGERVKFADQVEEILKNVEDPVLDCHRLHMAGGR